MKRVYDAAVRHKVIEGKNQLTELTEVLGLDSPQRVKNWDTRGASAEAMLLIQRTTGINATWIETGEGPEMVAGWPPGRRAADAKSLADSGPSEADLVDALAAALLNGSARINRHRVAEQLAALALAPDSKALRSRIAAELRDDGVDAVMHDPATGQLMLMQAKEWRQQAMRLAEAHPDARSKELLTDFLGKMDTLMRDQAPKTEKTDKTRHRG